MVYTIVRLLFKIFFRGFFRLKISGLENVDQFKEGGFLIAVNHISNLDPFLSGTFIKRKIYFFSKKELFKNKLGHWLFTNLNCLPVDRANPGPKAIKKIIAVLGAGEGLTIFPEGTRSKDGNIQDIKPGTGMIVAKTKVPLIPCYLTGTNKALPKGSFFPKRCDITISYGTPLLFEKIFSKEKSTKEDYLLIGEQIKKAFEDLKKGDTPSPEKRADT